MQDEDETPAPGVTDVHFFFLPSSGSIGMTNDLLLIHHMLVLFRIQTFEESKFHLHLS